MSLQIKSIKDIPTKRLLRMRDHFYHQHYWDYLWYDGHMKVYELGKHGGIIDEDLYYYKGLYISRSEVYAELAEREYVPNKVETRKARQEKARLTRGK